MIIGIFKIFAKIYKSIKPLINDEFHDKSEMFCYLDDYLIIVYTKWNLQN